MKIINNIRQKILVNRIKKLCFHPVYFAGCEIYRLLNYDTLPAMLLNIKKGRIELESKVLFGKKTISATEQFAYILNKYIVFVRDNFHIHATELMAIIEETLKSKYSKVLYSHLDFNSGINYEYFRSEFKRMFLESFFNNFQNLTNDEDIDNKLLLELRNLSLDNSEDLDKIYKVLKNIINLRENNIYHCFIKLKSRLTNDYEQRFYTTKWNMLIEDYCNKIINF